MDIKDALLKKGLPIVIVLAIIIGIAIFLSRPEKAPTVTNPDQVVAKLKGEEVTKGELYERIKNSASLSYILTQSDTAGQLYFLDMVDRELLSDYTYDGIEAEIDGKISIAKLMQGGDEAYEEYLDSLGLTESEAREYYKLTLLREEAARVRANDEITEDEIDDALNAKRPDVCIIPLRYLSEDDANAALEKASEGVNVDLTDEDIKLNFDVEYDSEDHDDLRMTGNVTDEDCDYVKLSLEKSASDFPNELKEHIEELEDNDYSTEPFTIEDGDDDASNNDPYYYIVYKVSTDELPARDEVKEDLVTDQVNAKDYIKTTIFNLRRDAGLKIFDNNLEETYMSIDQDFKENDDTSDETVLSFTVDGKKIKVTAEELYQETKMVFGVSKALPTINLEALQSVDAIKLTREEIRDFKLQLKDMKAAFGNQNMAQYGITWEDYLSYYFNGVRSDEAAIEAMKLSQLQSDYIKHVDPVTETEVQNAFDDWFKIEASHLLFRCDTSKDDIDEIACDSAKDQAQTVIDALNNVQESALKKHMRDDIPALYTGDNKIDGLSVKFEDLGEFGPLVEKLNPQTGEPTGDYQRMVPEFEEGAQAIAVGEYSPKPIKTSFGYHIILKTDEEEHPAEDTAEYDEIIGKLEAKLETESTSPQNIQKHIALLRDELDFTFEDDELQEQYEIIQAIYLEEETTEDSE